MLKSRGEYSGLSTDKDLRDDEEDDGGWFGSAGDMAGREKSMGNRFFICISRSTCEKQIRREMQTESNHVGSGYDANYV